MKRVGCSLVVTGLVAVLSSCYPGEISTTGETDLIVTGARPDYQFTKKTYFMPDTVFYIQADSLAPDTFDHAQDPTVLAAVEAGLNSYNFTRVNTVAAADMVVLNSALINVNITVWTYYPGYYPPYWGCCYGGYPWWPVSGATAWKSGTILTQMQDKSLNNPAGEDAGDVWMGVLNGLAEGSSASVSARITAGINQAFDQSPYLSGSGTSN